MQLTIKKKIGKDIHTFLVSGKNLHELAMEANKLSFGDVHKCGLCGSDNLVLGGRTAQGKYKYVDIKCQDCHGALTFGRTKEDPDTFFLRKADAGTDAKGKPMKKFDWQKYDMKKTQL